MKKILLSLTLFTCFSVAAIAQDEVAKAAPANPNAPEISFEEELHDFGTLPFGGNGNFDFKFTNTGKEPLVISNAKGSCGCTVPKWPKEPIMKGQTGSINVNYDTKRVGPFTKTVTINSNAKTASKTITIKGNVMSQEETENQSPIKKNSSFSPLEKTN
ncbi:MAG: DUF1573 domain-containing protein [Bacteroidia bacterium]|nr:DUF1573 domain-containing protein [Bacteroidia bacterium]HQU99816.1 DUF1573 domain-containing protein [Bacteroidia bacterium]